jgi:hypothetical protein
LLSLQQATHDRGGSKIQITGISCGENKEEPSASIFRIGTAGSFGMVITAHRTAVHGVTYQNLVIFSTKYPQSCLLSYYFYIPPFLSILSFSLYVFMYSLFPFLPPTNRPEKC